MGQEGATRLDVIRRLLALAALAGLGVALWWRKNPSACPYSQRFWIAAPHLLITRERLREALDPKPGERILEVGPGTGYYTLDLAQWVGSEGQLDIFDLQQEMLDHTAGRVAEAGLANVVPRQGDARSLSYEDDSFDAAVLVTVLGEIPDQEQALRELRRVVKPGGRVVVGEIAADPHFVTEGSLRERGEAAGLRFADRLGPPFGYFGRLEAPAAAGA
jgi:ubiquinone/menaquinone biosynthesis C-methylase UbiE